MKIGVALSGGGVFAAAHAGALLALQEAGLSFDMISGTSMGAVVAALYAAGYRADELSRILQTMDVREITGNYLLHLLTGKTRQLDIVRLSQIKRVPDGIIGGGMLEKQMERLLKAKHVSVLRDCPLPLAVTAVDVISGRLIYFVSRAEGLHDTRDTVYVRESGVSAAVRASFAYPLVFRPKQISPYLLVDGGVRESIPVDVLKRMGADRVLAIRCDGRGNSAFHGQGAVELSLRSLQLMGQELAGRSLRHADAEIFLKGEKVGLLDFTKLKNSIQLGYDQTNKQLSAAVKALLQ